MWRVLWFFAGAYEDYYGGGGAEGFDGTGEGWGGGGGYYGEDGQWYEGDGGEAAAGYYDEDGNWIEGYGADATEEKPIDTLVSGGRGSPPSSRAQGVGGCFMCPCPVVPDAPPSHSWLRNVTDGVYYASLLLCLVRTSPFLHFLACTPAHS